MKKKIFGIGLLVLVGFMLSACNFDSEKDDRLYVVATTSMLGDLVHQIGGEEVHLKTLMGPGVDPHLYELKPSDVQALNKADVIIVNGLNLEGKMVDTIENLKQRGKNVVIVGEHIEASRLIVEDGVYDPHIWFDIDLWKEVAKVVGEELKLSDEANTDHYDNGLINYIKELDDLKAFVMDKVSELPEDKRILVTAHDAFTYFGRAYGFEVHAIQGIATDEEPSVRDIEELAILVTELQVKAIFFESSIPEDTIRSVIENAKSKGWNVVVGGELYSDALGDVENDTETYVKTVKHNVTTIVDALK